MPRTLPWATNTAKAPARPRKPVKASIKPTRLKRASSDSEEDNEDKVASNPLGRKHVVSSSPLPGPPDEEFMRDGFENDDMYRMVEDELLAVAQKFTVHLHAAEYKRQQRKVQFRNAQTISSITRPTVGRMTHDTERKLENIDRTVRQKQVLDDVLGRKQSALSDDDSDEGADLPYAGTMLHNLMDSPRKRAKTLSAIVSKTTITRSAAGFKQPTVSSQEKSVPEPKKKTARKWWSSDEIVDSSHDDDELDAPVSALNFQKASRPSVKTSTMVLPPSHVQLDAPATAKESEFRSHPKAAGDTTISTSFALPSDSPPKLGGDRPRLSRFQRAQEQKKQEEEKNRRCAQRSKDVIPTFL